MVWSPHGPLACGGASGDRPSAQRERERERLGSGYGVSLWSRDPTCPGGRRHGRGLERANRRRFGAARAAVATPRWPLIDVPRGLATHRAVARHGRPFQGLSSPRPPPPSPIAVSGISEPSVCIEGTASI